MGVRLTKKQGRFTTTGAVGTEPTDDKESSEQSQNLSTTSPSVYGGGGGPVKAVTPVASQTKGSGFTNIQKILKASGTDQGPSRLAQTAAGGVKQAAVGAQQALSGAVSEYEQEREKASGELQSRKTGARDIMGRAQSGSLAEGDVASWKAATGGSFTGPTELTMTPEQRRAAAQSSALSKLAGDTAGRSALLQKYVGSPQYSQGKQQLDALLLGRGGSGAIRSALRQGTRAEQDIKRQEIIAQEQSKQLEQEAKNIAETAKTELSQAKSGLTGELQSTKEDFLNKQIGSAVSRIAKALQEGGNVRRSDLNLLNLNEKDFANLRYASGVSSALNAQDIIEQLKGVYGTADIGAFASREQRGRAEALGQLANENLFGIPGFIDSVYDYDPNKSAYFNLGAYAQDVEAKIQDNLINDPQVKRHNSEFQRLNKIGSPDNIYYYDADLLSELGRGIGVEGANKFNLNEISDRIPFKPSVMGFAIPDVDVDSIYNEIYNQIWNKPMVDFTYTNHAGQRRSLGRDLATEGDPYGRKKYVARELAEVAYQRAIARKQYENRYNQILNTPALKFNFID
jgi:hypothetical protein